MPHISSIARPRVLEVGHFVARISRVTGAQLRIKLGQRQPRSRVFNGARGQIGATKAHCGLSESQVIRLRDRPATFLPGQDVDPANSSMIGSS